VVVMFFGEYASVAALYRGRDTVVTHRLAGTGVLAGMALVVLPLLGRPRV